MNDFKTVGSVDGKADEDDMRIGVADGTETVIVFSTWRLPKRQLHVLSTDLDISDVVLENGWHINLCGRISI